MPLDFNTALNSYGFVGQLANAIPDLRDILKQAIAGEWVPEQFTRAVMDSKWWKGNAESVRQISRLRATDPATYNQSIRNAQSKVTLMARELGVGGINAQQLGLRAMMENWDDEQLRAQIGQGKLATGAGGQRFGTAAQYQAHMKELAANYGVSYTDSFIDGWTSQVLSGRNTLDGFDSLIKARAKAQFPHLAQQIDAGMTVRDIADPYIATYAQTLEVPETGIKLNDPAIQKALQVKDPKTGAFSNKPMYEFQRQLKEDPRWDKTKNATEEAYRMVSRLGKDMGFLS